MVKRDMFGYTFLYMASLVFGAIIYTSIYVHIAFILAAPLVLLISHDIFFDLYREEMKIRKAKRRLKNEAVRNNKAEYNKATGD